MAIALSRWLSAVLPPIRPWPVQIAPSPTYDDEPPCGLQTIITMMVITRDNLSMLAKTEELPDTMAVLVDLEKDELDGSLRAYPAWVLKESAFVDMMLTLNYIVEPPHARTRVIHRARWVWHRIQAQLQVVLDPPFGCKPTSGQRSQSTARNHLVTAAPPCLQAS
ncbi:MAG: hypothetical protein KTR25_14665 [Myxococcales bacterium]|nr:hypothetical protein [Myxococcales bacterium]